MVPALKAEFKKLLTVRSTYLLVLIALILSSLFTYFGTSATVYEEKAPEPTASEQRPETAAGPETNAGQSANNQPQRPETRITKVTRDLSKEKLITNLQDGIPFVSIFIAVSVVLLMGHEFRYNTITYTLTTSKSRSRVLFSKFIVSVIFTIVAALLAIATIIAVTYAAVNIKDLNLPAQGGFDWGYILARLVGYALGLSLIGLAIITLVRNLTAGIVALFLLPTLDAIVGELLKNWQHIEPSKLLPFSALNRIENLAADYILRKNVPDDGVTDTALLPATLLGAAAVFAAYFIGIWIVSWYIFLRRDATN